MRSLFVAGERCDPETRLVLIEFPRRTIIVKWPGRPRALKNRTTKRHRATPISTICQRRVNILLALVDVLNFNNFAAQFLRSEFFATTLQTGFYDNWWQTETGLVELWVNLASFTSDILWQCNKLCEATCLVAYSRSELRSWYQAIQFAACKMRPLDERPSVLMEQMYASVRVFFQVLVSVSTTGCLPSYTITPWTCRMAALVFHCTVSTWSLLGCALWISLDALHRWSGYATIWIHMVPRCLTIMVRRWTCPTRPRAEGIDFPQTRSHSQHFLDNVPRPSSFWAPHPRTFRPWQTMIKYDKPISSYIILYPKLLVQAGSLLVKLPLPPGTFPTLWKNDAGGLPVPSRFAARLPKTYSNWTRQDDSRWRTISIQGERENQTERERERKREWEIESDLSFRTRDEICSLEITRKGRKDPTMILPRESTFGSVFISLQIPGPDWLTTMSISPCWLVSKDAGEPFPCLTWNTLWGSYPTLTLLRWALPILDMRTPLHVVVIVVCARLPQVIHGGIPGLLLHRWCWSHRRTWVRHCPGAWLRMHQLVTAFCFPNPRILRDFQAFMILDTLHTLDLSSTIVIQCQSRSRTAMVGKDLTSLDFTWKSYGRLG